MINAFIVDDDAPSIKIIEFFLKDYSVVKIAGTFEDPVAAVERFRERRPQVVFLDINMKRMTGMEAAALIMNICPETDIVFTTAYDNFAVAAFELNAVDYLIKPIMKPRFDKTMDRILEKHYPKTTEGIELNVMCFGKFRVFRPGGEPVKWKTEKSKELAALLIYNRGRQVSRDEIIELLWPDTDVGRAVRYLHNSIYYIRKSLGEYGVDRRQLRISGNYIVLIGDKVYNDLAVYREIVRQEKKDIKTYEKLKDICKGDFLEGEDWVWAVPERENIINKCAEAAINLSGYYIERNNCVKAEEILKTAYNKNPYDERITTLLLKLYVTTNQRIKAIRHFNEYSLILKKDLGLPPGKYIKEIINSI